MEQGGADLPAHVCLAGADGLDVSLVKKNPVRWAGVRHALLRARNAVKQPQQQPFALRFLRWPVFHDDRYVGKLLAKRPWQAVQGLRDECLELPSLHVTLDCSPVFTEHVSACVADSRGLAMPKART